MSPPLSEVQRLFGAVLALILAGSGGSNQRGGSLDLERQDASGCTLMHYVCGLRNLPALKLLLVVLAVVGLEAGCCRQPDSAGPPLGRAALRAARCASPPSTHAQKDERDTRKGKKSVDRSTRLPGRLENLRPCDLPIYRVGLHITSSQTYPDLPL